MSTTTRQLSITVCKRLDPRARGISSPVALNITPDEVMAVSGESLPWLGQSIEALPAVADGGNDVPGVEGLTRFDGSAVTTVPELRDYFAGDAIPVFRAAAGQLPTARRDVAIRHLLPAVADRGGARRAAVRPRHGLGL
ncbi:MAG: hypothetical protein ACRDZO_07750 [Egibacteraceae bacterium]